MPGMEDRFDPPERFASAGDELHELVTSRTGLADFGGDDYRAGLEVLLKSMDYDPQFSEQGRRQAWGEIVGTLSARARAVQAMRETPGFESTAIREPVVITGIPRSGTTALHRLMAVDAQFQGLQAWLLGAPMPRPPREEWESHPLFLEAVERIQARYASNPGLRAAHAIVAEELEECLWVLRHGFVSNIWTSGWSAASYDLWWQTQSEEPSYRYYHRVLQLIGSREPEKRWLLKNPGHISQLALLFELFPDAKVIQTHRDPARAVPSLCALLMHQHPIMEAGRSEIHAQLLAIRETEKWAKALRDAEPAREAHRGQILDVVHGDFHREPMKTIERIYAFLGLSLAPQVASAMEQRIQAAPERSHGEHRYDVRDFGMSEDGIRERYGDYVERFDLKLPDEPAGGAR